VVVTGVRTEGRGHRGAFGGRGVGGNGSKKRGKKNPFEAEIFLRDISANKALVDLMPALHRNLTDAKT